MRDRAHHGGGLSDERDGSQGAPHRSDGCAGGSGEGELDAHKVRDGERGPSHHDGLVVKKPGLNWRGLGTRSIRSRRKNRKVIEAGGRTRYGGVRTRGERNPWRENPEGKERNWGARTSTSDGVVGHKHGLRRTK